MLKFIIIIVLGVILAGASATFAIKNFLIKYKGSSSGFKNLSCLFLICVSLFSSLISIWVSFSLREILLRLKISSNLSAKMIQMLNGTVVEQTKEVTISIIVGYVCFIFAYLVFKNIEKEIKREIDKPKLKWDWSKISKI